YCIGATFHYKDQMEVFPLAMEPEYYEFEITKILLRLKEKHEKSLVMEDVLKAGGDLVKSAASCMERIKSEKKDEEEEGGLGSLFKGKEEIQKMVGAIRLKLDDIRKDCGKFNETLLTVKNLAGKNGNLDLLLESAQKFGEMLSEFFSSIAGADEQGERKILAIKEKLAELNSLVERDGDSLKDAPGKKVVGFSCGQREFCPFRDLQPLIRPEIAGLLGQKNMFVQQFVNQAKQIEDQINSINMQIEKGLFTRRGLDVRRVDLEDGIPDDVSALVLYGPQESYSERTLYEIDQFLLSGKSVILFVNNYDVSVYNLRMSEDFQDGTFDLMNIESYPANIEQLIEHFGVKINKNLVMEKKNYGAINVIQVQRQGQFNIQSQREFPYPLLPVFSDFSKESVLTRNLVSVTLPYVSSLTILDKAKANQEVEAHELIRSSPDSVVSSGDFELVPPALLRQVSEKESDGPHAVAAMLKGKFTSYFKGKEIPKRPEKKESNDPMERMKPKIPERAFKETGSGRLLVIGSNLGLESLTTEKVFDGFEMSQLSSGQADFFLKLRDYIARFQNWQLRLSQVGGVLQDNLDFLYNVLDWGVQQDALVEIRSKGVLKRPIANLSETAQSLVSYGYIFGLPFIFVIFGLLSYL
ncbi:MAG: Gldg family protein, partial [Deltaproteobacteria bacterium]|nr:Gldg family protein [Deltaproteobacteria bacterium]